MSLRRWIVYLEQRLNARIELLHRRRFEALCAKLDAAEGPIEPAKGRSRIDAVRGSLHSFPYMLWTVRRQVWLERAFQFEVGAMAAGGVLGWMRGFSSVQWLLLAVVGGAAILAEANNTATEIKLRRMQQKFFGETKLDIDIGDMFEFAALPVAMCAYPWGIMWVIFMISPGPF